MRVTLCERSRWADCSNGCAFEWVAGAWGDLAKELARFASEDDGEWTPADDAVLTLRKVEAVLPSQTLHGWFRCFMKERLKHASPNVPTNRESFVWVVYDDNSNAWEHHYYGHVSKSFLQYAAAMSAEDPESVGANVGRPFSKPLKNLLAAMEQRRR